MRVQDKECQEVNLKERLCFNYDGYYVLRIWILFSKQQEGINRYFYLEILFILFFRKKKLSFYGVIENYVGKRETSERKVVVIIRIGDLIQFKVVGVCE